MHAHTHTHTHSNALTHWHEAITPLPSHRYTLQMSFKMHIAAATKESLSLSFLSLSLSLSLFSLSLLFFFFLHLGYLKRGPEGRGKNSLYTIWSFSLKIKGAFCRVCCKQKCDKSVLETPVILEQIWAISCRLHMFLTLRLLYQQIVMIYVAAFHCTLIIVFVCAVLPCSTVSSSWMCFYLWPPLLCSIVHWSCGVFVCTPLLCLLRVDLDGGVQNAKGPKSRWCIRVRMASYTSASTCTWTTSLWTSTRYWSGRSTPVSLLQVRSTLFCAWLFSWVTGHSVLCQGSFSPAVENCRCRN